MRFWERLKINEIPEKVMVISTYRAIGHKAEWPITDLPLAQSVVSYLTNDFMQYRTLVLVRGDHIADAQE
jgi:hypothetical protein